MSITIVYGPISTASAQGRIAVVRDAEIEGLLLDYARPIFKAAGLSRKGIDIILVNNPSFNAFVDGRRIFINTGALATAATPNEIIGVIAHESGHLAGGHQQRLREQIARARTLAVVGALAGIGAAAAGSLSGTEGAAAVGGGLAQAAPSVAQRALLSYRRSEEITADRAAVKYLNATGQSAKGMLTTFKRFSQNNALAGVRANPYEQSHPLPRDRIALLDEIAKKSRHYNKKDSPALQRRHDMIRGKIAAYSGGAPAVGRVFRNNPNSVGARYGMAISAYLRGDTRRAMSEIDKLIAGDRNNAYLHEMKGEIFLKARQPSKAASAFAKAVQLDKYKSGILRGRLGFAYLSTGNPAEMKKAIRELRASLTSDPNNFNAYTYLSRAYAKAGDVANAELTQAEGYFRAGKVRDAKRFAARAQQKMKKGTPSWQRANDIVKYKSK
ncbi:M48 family metalloprotease [Nitratireductor sp. XY-223]|uniref:M48 family metalloprotease n=1 Tax=Nitratireductor sp. XY-223 TaxID=2561926 RepID=UPI001FED4397|nr:M48 family metalloprotease [Nitratireductor sp. XY-223]